jgi:hypothetical protein
MLRAPTPLAATLILVVSACSETIAPDQEEQIENLPAADAELRCLATEDIPSTNAGPISGSVQLGPCGHAAFHDDQGQGWLLTPDAERSEFEHEQVEFASTGDLVAWEFDDALRLRDLLGGSERSVLESGPIDNFGFVPSFTDPSRSAWLWSCEQGVLERHDLDESSPVAESVVCSSVVGSSGSPRLVYADTEGRVWLADLDQDLQLGSDDHEFAGHDGSKRDDTLWIDHDGELFVHVAIEWQGDDDVDSEWPVSLWARVLDRHGEIVRDTPEGLAWRQAARRGAPVFVFDEGEIVRFDAGAPSTVAGTPEETELAESGELFFATESDELFVTEPSPTTPLTSIGHLDVPVEISASPSGTIATLEHHSETCILDDQGECDRIVAALRRWTRDFGLDELVLYSTSPWELLATTDDGHMLVIGSPVEVDGPTYTGEQPPPRVLFLSADGEIEAELPAPHGALAVRQVFVLGPDRVLFEYQSEDGIGAVMMAGSEFGFSSSTTTDIALLQVWVAPGGRRYAYVAELPGSDTLQYSSLF